MGLEERLNGVSLGEYAGVRAGADAGEPIDRVLDHEGVDRFAWSSAESAWARRLDDDARSGGMLARDYHTAHASALSEWKRGVRPRAAKGGGFGAFGVAPPPMVSPPPMVNAPPMAGGFGATAPPTTAKGVPNAPVASAAAMPPMANAAAMPPMANAAMPPMAGGFGATNGPPIANAAMPPIAAGFGATSPPVPNAAMPPMANAAMAVAPTAPAGSPVNLANAPAMPPMANAAMPPMANAAMPPMANAAMPPMANAAMPPMANAAMPPMANAAMPPMAKSGANAFGATPPPVTPAGFAAPNAPAIAQPVAAPSFGKTPAPVTAKGAPSVATPPPVTAPPVTPGGKAAPPATAGLSSKAAEAPKAETKPAAPVKPKPKKSAKPRNERVLSMLEFASVSMGLEVLPQRADDVYESFELHPVDGAREVELWNKYFEEKPRDKIEFEKMRQRMRDHWVRWNQSHPPEAAAPSAAASSAAASSAVKPSTAKEDLKTAPSTSADGRTLSMLEWASLCAGLEVAPQRADEIYKRFGLDAASKRTKEEDLWKKYLDGKPHEQQEFERMKGRMRSNWSATATPEVQKMAPAAMPEAYGAPAPATPKPVGGAGGGGGARILSILEYASLSIGLELVPHRAEDIYNKFGLKDPQLRDREMNAWKAYLADNPSEQSEWAKMRSRMRSHWDNFDRQPAGGGGAGAFAAAPPMGAPRMPSIPPAMPPIAAPAVPPAAPRMPSIPPAMPPIAAPQMPMAAPPPAMPAPAAMSPAMPNAMAAPTPQNPGLTLLEYATLCAELAVAPQQSEAIFARYGLGDRARRSAVNDAWQSRLVANRMEYAEWQRIRDNKQRSLEAAQQPPQSTAPFPDPGISLADYAMLVVEVELAPDRGEGSFRRLGLADPSRRWSVDQAWRARLAVDPRVQQEYQAHVAAVRRRWGR